MRRRSRKFYSVATASAIRTEGEVRRMRQDALFHAKVTFPFSSETSTLVDAPGAQIGVAESSKPKAENMKGSMTTDLEGSSTSDIPESGTDDVTDPLDNAKDSPQIKYVEKGNSSSQIVRGSGNTSASSNALLAPAEDQMDYSSSTPVESVAPIGSETETLRSESNCGGSPSQDARELPIWFGDLSRPGFEQSYLSMRDRLSDAAYWGDFDQIFSVLAEAEQRYRQLWGNAPRLSQNPQQTSGWTPLHQAAFMGAHKDNITHLIRDFGALRLLRTAWTDSSELAYRNMTAVEIAHDSGFTDLYNVLAPVIYHCIPSSVLATLQTHFHDLIRLDLRESADELANLRLPDLVVLTELEEPMMWFPLKPRGVNSVRGYMYWLDGRELLIKTFGMSQPTRDPRLAKCPILSCEYRSRGFAREYDKQRHILTHFKGIVSCPFCPLSSSISERSFAKIDIFKRHLTSVHNVEQIRIFSLIEGQLSSDSARQSLNQHEEASGDCSVCNGTFANPQHLYEHLDACITRLVQQEEPSGDFEYGTEFEDLQKTGLYRISEGGVREIEEAIAFNV